MCEKLQDLAERVIDKMDEENIVSQDTSLLAILKMEEILHILIKMMDC